MQGHQVINSPVRASNMFGIGRLGWRAPQATDAFIWTLDSGLWILDSGFWTLDSGLWTLEMLVTVEMEMEMAMCGCRSSREQGRTISHALAIEVESIPVLSSNRRLWQTRVGRYCTVSHENLEILSENAIYCCTSNCSHQVFDALSLSPRLQCTLCFPASLASQP